MKLTENRYAVLAVATLSLISLGVLYSWSVFIPSLETEFNSLRSEVSLAFSLSMICWTLGMLSAGKLTKVLSPRACFALGSGLVVVAFFASSQASSMAMLYITYGFLCGFGLGLSYNLWMSYILRFFPDHIGLVTGIMLLGFGLGAMIWSAIASCLLQIEFSWRDVFCIIGITIALVSCIALPFLKNTSSKRVNHPQTAPGPAQTSNTSLIKPMVKRPSFWSFTLWKVLVMGSAAAVIAQSSVILNDIGTSLMMAATAVGAINIGNALGRLITGLLFDRIGQDKMMILLPATCLIATVGMICSYLAVQPVFLILFLLIEGLAYGGYANLNISFIRNSYGQDSLSLNMGISSFTLMPFNLITPVAAALVFDTFGNYYHFLLILPLIALVSLIAGIFTNRLLKHE